MRKKLLFAGVAMIVAAGCYNDKYATLYPTPANVVCDTTTATYSTDIKPIIDAKCATSGCHDAGGAGGGYIFTTYAGFMVAVNSGKLLGSINWSSGYVAMPQALPKLDQCDIDKITRWVNLGAANN